MQNKIIIKIRLKKKTVSFWRNKIISGLKKIDKIFKIAEMDTA